MNDDMDDLSAEYLAYLARARKAAADWRPSTSRYTVTLPSPEVATFVAEHPAVAVFAVASGCTVLFTDEEALRALAAVPADHDGHYDGEHLWIGGTEYVVTRQVVLDQASADIIEATGADWLPCGCLGTQPEHTCGPRETADTDDEREAERAGWQSTAEILTDPELTAALTDPIEADHGPVPPPLPPVMLTATFTLTVTVQRDRWAGLDGPAEDDPEGDFWGYVSDGSSFAEHLRDGMAALRDADGTVTVTPVARAVARGQAYLPGSEPPVGTRLYRGEDLIWTRRAEGWYCVDADVPCPNCPCQWSEVWDIGGVRGADVHAEPPR